MGMPVAPPDNDLLTLGTVFFVDNSHANKNNNNPGLDSSFPLATTAAAVALCTANKGDVIILGQGHAETLASAAALALSVAGVTVIGLGRGTKRPTFTWATGTDATCTIAGANVKIKNILAKSTIAALVTLFSITGADVTLDAVDYQEDGSTAALQFILTTTAADGLQVLNSKWYRGTTAAGALSQWIVLTGVDRARIINNFCILKGYAAANPINSIVAVVGTACLSIEIVGNRFYDSNSTGNVPILMITNCTGVIAWNVCGTSKTGIAGAIVPASCFCFENYVSNEVDKSGMAEPAIDTA